MSTVLADHPLSKQYFVYILNKSPAKMLASSPPVPALISTTTFLESSGSLGIRRIFNSSSSFGIILRDSSSCFFAISWISGSDSSLIKSRASDSFDRVNS